MGFHVEGSVSRPRGCGGTNSEISERRYRRFGASSQFIDQMADGNKVAACKEAVNVNQAFDMVYASVKQGNSNNLYLAAMTAGMQQEQQLMPSICSAGESWSNVRAMKATLDTLSSPAATDAARQRAQVLWTQYGAELGC